MPSKHAVIALFVALALPACAVESQIAPRSPLDVEPRCAPVASVPPPVAHVDIAPPPVANAYFAPPARHLPPGSVSLGFIGDDPIGRHPTVPHRAPSWTRPFPSSWSSSYHTPMRHTGGYRR